MASERGRGQTGSSNIPGVADPHNAAIVQPNGMGRPSAEGERPVGEGRVAAVGIQSTAGHEKSRGKPGGPPSKPKYYLMTDRGAVP